MILPPINLGQEDAPVLAEVHPIPVKQRTTDTGRVLTELRKTECFHRRFTIDERLAHVECRDCGVVLNPMHALLVLSRQESQYHQYHERYQDELKRLAERSKTKCTHCGQMTRISNS